MTIKDVYYFDLCNIRVTLRNSYGREYLDCYHILPNCEHIDLKFHYGKPRYDRYKELREAYTWEQLLELRAAKQQEWRDEFLPGDTRIFIIVPYQEADLRIDMENLGLSRYKVYESDWAVNANYPENGPYLKVFIYHIPKETNE